jgi:hypothetical protein
MRYIKFSAKTDAISAFQYLKNGELVRVMPFQRGKCG